MLAVRRLKEDLLARGSRLGLHGVVMAGGLAALSWEVLWQLKASLALGVSAMGTALTLAATMGGMTLGCLLIGRLLRRYPPRRPVRVYGLMELVIGVSGLFLTPAFALLERVDSAVYQSWPGGAPLIHLAGIAVILGPPTLAMGATVPLFGLIAPRFRTSIALLYGLNTLGAGLGILFIALVILPACGVAWTIGLVATVNISVCVVTWLLVPAEAATVMEETASAPAPSLSAAAAAAVVFITGFGTFGLEVAWFRALRAAYLSTTYTFAVLLAAVLLPLGLAARKAPELSRRGVALGAMLAAAGVAVLLATPLVERADLLARHYAFFVLPSWFVLTLLLIGPAIFLMGVALPWLLDQQHTPGAWAKLYAINTLGAVLGALLAAWVLLPSLGFARTAWLLGSLILAAALCLCDARQRLVGLAAGLAAFGVAVGTESGIGRHRTIGAGASGAYRLLGFRETPDSTISVTDHGGHRVLYIDGFAASDSSAVSDYMIWMGRLPVILHPRPCDGLVICFGTGQTANAVRQEEIERLDLVDISAAVFDVALLFPVNQGVLDDPRTTAITMDGRAWLRRTSRRYDLVTLEPMPPTFAGVNALYSLEFYELLAKRLKPGGIVAQWLPFHLVNAYQAASIAATFRTVFPDSFLWIDPLGRTGILLGRRGPVSAGAPALGTEWPGLERSAPGRALDSKQIIAARALDAAGLERFARPGTIISDDNQLLAYSWSFNPGLTDFQRLSAINLARVKQAAAGEMPQR